MSTSPARRRRRQMERDAAAHPRCPFCTNEIAKRDRAKTEDGRPIHYVCQKRLEEAAKTAEVARSAQRMKAQGFFIPGGQS